MGGGGKKVGCGDEEVEKFGGGEEGVVGGREGVVG